MRTPKNTKVTKANADRCEMLLNDSEDLQIQDDDNDNDLNFASSHAQAYEILDDAIRVLDHMLSQQKSN
ncbi:unnamed protein product [Adineta ricciae]|uniref:Uncharacterized protein n=1 Tax=Adineta ricciae TaxID=249248 RepID=A0A815D605_ADIRI|nr:unnamed protein product [Adineta ricciae]CAF1297130.1 unnamed protein product [Adineta ricciae]